MTLPSNPTSASASSRALAQQRYNQALELEKQLRSLLQGKGPFDPSVRALRNRICESYEAVILENHEFAESHEVEQAIWRLQYKCIEEFRARIRKSTAAAAAAASAPAIPMPGAKVPARRDSSQKILAVFKSFLAEATGFYHNLILKLRAKHGLPQDYSPFEVEQGARDEERTAELRSCDLSCHRCLIFLGDLARYKESHGDADIRSRDWSVAAGYYHQAISLWPSSGNPHNQLAVLATYVGDELLAVYRYFRSLAVESPFLTARDNLIILFEKNRNHYAQLPSNESAIAGKMDSGKGSDKTKASRGDRILPVGDGALKLAVKDRQLEGVEIGELRKRFRLRFVRLNGILFTKTSLETFVDVYSTTVRELEELLSPEDTILESGIGTDHRSGIGTGSGGAAGFLQVVAILIFTVHNINWVPDSHHPTYAEILQRSALYQHAFTAAFECAGRLMRRCAESKVVSKSPLLPAMLVFLEWLACRPEMAAGSDIDEKQGHARNFFWRQSIALLNSCAEAYKRNGSEVGLEGGLAPATGYGDENGVGGVALWEDYELRGFVPVIPAQLTLDFSKRSPRVGLGDKKEREVRLQRLMAAGRAIASALEGTEKGICYEEEEERFAMAGEQREKKDVHYVDAPSVQDNGRALPKVSVDEEAASGSSLDKNTVEDRISLPSLETVFPEREEEDEEVIVFKPMVKDQSSTSASGGTWKNMVSAQIPNVRPDAVSSVASGQVGLDNLVMSRGLAAALQMPSLDVQRSTSTTSSIRQFGVSDTSLVPTPVSANGRQFVAETSLLPIHSLGFTEQVPVISVPGSVGTSPSSTASSPLAGYMSSLPGTHALVTEDLRGVNGTYGFPPSSAEDWLNRVTGSSSCQSASWDTNIFSNGSEKFAGVIGQPKQAAVSNSLWSTNLDGVTLSGLSSLTLAGSDYGRPQGSSLGGLPHSAISLDSLIQASVKDAPSIANGMFSSGDLHMLSSRNGAIGRSFAQSTPVSAESESSDTELVKSSLALRSATVVAANPATSSSSTQSPKEAPSTGPVRSAMRPPPGFGPLPTKSASVAASVTAENPQQQNVSKSVPSSRPSEKDEHQAVDDYGWLDDYSQKGTIGQIGYYQGQGSSLYSSDYGIWASGAMNTTTPGKVTATTSVYPFPGMGASQQEQLSSNRREVDNQRQQYTLLEQLLQQQEQHHLESQRLGYRVDQPQLHSSSNNSSRRSGMGSTIHGIPLCRKLLLSRLVNYSL
ncbi:hypothetical protein R1flu_027741 [Riccia fluitans]|uniref:Telomerase activating protein Est1 n=1 Tax=Riccia fluitans TaxID=41844 RepID=A0ABD1XKD8_9MARC